MKVLCASMSGPGHTYPMVAVASALRARGHEVTLASSPDHERDARAAGLAHVSLPDVGGSPLHALRPFDDAGAAAEVFLPAMRALAPDVVVHDVVTMSPALAAEACGVPFATLVIHALHTPSRHLPPFGFGGAPGRGPHGRFRDAFMRRGNERTLARAREDLNRARARVGLPPTDRLEGQLSPRLVLVATLPSLEVERPDWPRQAHVVGPCLWEPPDAPAPPLPDGDAPLVLVAPSTAHDQSATLRAAVEAVEALRLRAVVTAGATPLGAPLPLGVSGAAFASHAAVLAHASATVCSGGHGIVARSLASGVPVVVVPGPGDQKENAWRAERAGAGITVRRPSKRAVRAALARALDDSAVRASAARLRDEASAMDGPARAAELVEDLARGALGA